MGNDQLRCCLFGCYGSGGSRSGGSVALTTAVSTTITTITTVTTAATITTTTTITATVAAITTVSAAIAAHSEANPAKVNTSESDAKRALLLPQEILRLPKDEAIITHTGMYATRAKRIKWYEEKPFMDLGEYPVPDVPEIEVKVRLDRSEAPPAEEAESQEPHGPQGPPPPTSLIEDPAGAVDVSDELVTEEEALEPPMMPHRANSLLATIHGQEIDLSGFGLEDGKAAVEALIAKVPTEAERIAAE